MTRKNLNTKKLNTNQSNKVNQVPKQPISQPVIQSTKHSIEQSAEQSTKHSVEESVEQSIIQSNQSNNQNACIKFRVDGSTTYYRFDAPINCTINQFNHLITHSIKQSTNPSVSPLNFHINDYVLEYYHEHDQSTSQSINPMFSYSGIWLIDSDERLESLLAFHSVNQWPAVLVLVKKQSINQTNNLSINQEIKHIDFDDVEMVSANDANRPNDSLWDNLVNQPIDHSVNQSEQQLEQSNNQTIVQSSMIMNAFSALANVFSSMHQSSGSSQDDEPINHLIDDEDWTIVDVVPQSTVA